MTWNAASRTLTIGTPGGNPRVFTSTRFTPSFSKDSTPTEIKEIGKSVAQQDDVKIQWGRAPGELEAGKGSSAAAARAGTWLAAVLAAAAAVVGLW